jgi:hypothetical protein
MAVNSVKFGRSIGKRYRRWPSTYMGMACILTVSGLHAALINVGGCCASRTFLCRNGTVKVETQSTDAVDICYACVWQMDTEVVVYGAVRRRAHTCALMRFA